MKSAMYVILAAILFSGCTPSNELRVAWKAGDYPPKQFKNIGIVAMLKSNEARIDVENGIVDALRAKGIHATTTWDIWPFANNPAIMKQAGFEGEKAKEIIQHKVAEHTMDALLIITLFDAFKEERYVPGKSVTVGLGISPGMYSMYPIYGYPYYTYFGYAFNTITEPGYYVDASTYFTEANLYDISTEKLIWTGQMTTTMQTSPEQEGEQFGRVLVNGMIRGDVVTKE